VGGARSTTGRAPFAFKGPADGKQEGVDTRLLGIYLNDHLAGAVGGTELARRALSNNRGTRLEPDLERLAGEIEEDRQTLEDLIARLGVSRSVVKTSAAWILEKAARLKLNGQPLGYSPLSRVIELEALAVGVEAKRALWAALKRLEGVDLGVDLDEMVARAQRQKRLLERRRLEAVAAAFEG
jgi:hypothetical protein